MPWVPWIRQAFSFALQRHPDLTASAGAFAIFLVFLLGSRRVPQRLLLRMGGLLLLLWLVAFVALGVMNASTHTFSSSVEPSVLNISLAYLHGQSMYHAPDSAERYSLLYGPLTFLYYAGLFHIFGTGIIHAKLYAMAATASSAVICMACFHHVGGRRGLILGGGYLLLGFAQAGQIAMSVLADPIVLLCTAVALLSVLRLPRYFAALVCGASLGAAINLKAHGALYILPFFAILWERGGFRAVVIALAIAAAVAVAPFSFSNQISFSNYLVLIHLAARHARHPAQFLWYPKWLVMLIFPVAALLICDFRRARHWLRPRGHALFVILLAACMALTIFPASKIGAGMHHFLPYFIALGFLMAAINGQADDVHKPLPAEAESLKSSLPRVGSSITAAYAFMGTLLLLFQIVLRNEGRLRSTDREIVTDLENIQAQFPSGRVAMGYGDDNDYRLTFYRAALSSRNQPAPIDASALIDLKLSGTPIPAATLAMLDRREIRVFLIPRGNEPFSMTLCGDQLFDERFRSAFLTNYRKCGESRFYDLWCPR